MKTYKEYLIERRSNHESNPKVSAYEHLKPYKDNTDIYISFTDVDKIGVNPKSKFNTPTRNLLLPLT